MATAVADAIDAADDDACATDYGTGKFTDDEEIVGRRYNEHNGMGTYTCPDDGLTTYILSHWWSPALWVRRHAADCSGWSRPPWGRLSYHGSRDAVASYATHDKSLVVNFMLGRDTRRVVVVRIATVDVAAAAAAAASSSSSSTRP